jgi:carboxypeptidase family protein
MQVSNLKNIVLSMLVMMCIPLSCALAQVSGSISGRVEDTSGASVPAVTVTVNDTETGASRRVTTDDAGNYRMLSLSVGHYEVRAEKPGFKTVVRRGISLAVAQEAVVDLEMQVGEVTQQVTVTAESPVVNTTTSQLSGLVGEQQVKDLPLNGRSFDNLITLNPGAINYTALKGNAASGGGGNYFTVAGRRPLENLYLLNGIEYTGSTSIGITPGGVSGELLGIDAVREFNVLTDAYSAEYGKRAGAHVSVVTQSGTNQLHGSVFEFVRNSAFDARNFFDGGTVPPFQRNQFGGSLGGPIKKDKAFLFGNYEGERQRLGLTDLVFVPNDDARRGFLPIGPNNSLIQVPSLDTSMLPFMALWPEPNGPDLGGGIAQFSANPKQSIREDFGTVRFDQNFSQKDNVNVSDTFDDGRALTPFSDPFFGNNVATRAQVISVQETHTFSPTLVNTVRVGFSRSRFFENPSPLGSVPPNLEMMQGQEPGAFVIGGGTAAQAFASSIVPAGVSGLQENVFNIRNLFTGQDDVQIIRGKHQFGFGGWAQRMQVNANSRDYQLGQATFASLTTFLQGQATLFTGAPQATVMYWRQWEGAWYAQDNIQLRPNLTIRLGLRHEFTNGWNEKYGRASQFLPDANGVLENTPTVGNSAFPVNNATKLFGPRVGIAYDPFGNGKTSIRAAFGVYYTLLDDLSFQLGVLPPFNAQFSFQPAILPNLIPVSSTTPLPPGCGPGVPKPCTTYAGRGVDAGAKTPTAVEWNYSMEQALSQNMSLRIGYVGSHSYHNLIGVDPNSIPSQMCSNAAGCLAGGIMDPSKAPPALVPVGTQYIPSLGPLGRPDPYLGNGFFWYTEGVSNYNAVEVDLTKRVSNGLTFRGSYTFSKNLDDGSGLSSNEATNQTQNVLDRFDPLRDYGRSALDFEHQASGNFSYQLPLGSGRRFLTGLHGVSDKLLSGWQMNGILTVLSGFPVTPLVGSNQSGDGDARNPDRPNLNPNFQGNALPLTVNQWFDPSAFSLPTAGTWGNAGRGIINGPGMADFDFSLFKTTPIKESATLEFRAEFFNITNAVNFGVPNVAVFSSGKISSSAGRITSTTTTSRQIQFGLKLLF